MPRAASGLVLALSAGAGACSGSIGDGTSGSDVGPAGRPSGPAGGGPPRGGGTSAPTPGGAVTPGQPGPGPIDADVIPGVAPVRRLTVLEFNDTVRDLEKQLQTTRVDLGRCGGDPGMPVNHLDGANYPTLVKVSMDLMVAALRCDVTRVAGLATADSLGANIDFSFVPGVPDRGTGYENARRNWHDLGHNPLLGGVDHKRIVDKWWMGQFASLIERLKAVPEPPGSMFDTTVVLWANHMEEGANHNSQKTPWMVAGRGGGYLRTGQCAASDGKALNGVLVELCNAVGVPTQFFGSQEFGGAMPGLRA